MTSKKNIIFLIGPMGSGKSSVGRKLARKYDRAFVDLDTLIETEMMMTIPEIFAKYGEDYFRRVETECLQLASQLNNTIISCGGGTPAYNGNMDYIREVGYSIYFDTPIDILYGRLRANRARRPLVASLNDDELYTYIQNLLLKRLKYYQQSDFTVNPSSFRDVCHIIDQIIPN